MRIEMGTAMGMGMGWGWGWDWDGIDEVGIRIGMGMGMDGAQLCCTLPSQHLTLQREGAGPRAGTKLWGWL